MNKKKIIATGAVVAALTLGVLGFTNSDLLNKETETQTAFKTVTLALKSSGIGFDEELKDENFLIYCDFDNGLQVSEYTNRSKKIIDGEILAEEMVERNIQYAVIGNEYYTENGENLIEVIAQRTYDATKVERKDGTCFYMATWGGVVEGDKAKVTQKMYIVEEENLTLPPGYELVSIEGIIPTKSFSELENKDVYSQGKENILTLK